LRQRSSEINDLNRYNSDDSRIRAFWSAFRLHQATKSRILARGRGHWRLDLTMMQSAIRFGCSNAWRFPDGPPADYAFAFNDWAFDGNGFPKK